MRRLLAAALVVVAVHGPAWRLAPADAATVEDDPAQTAFQALEEGDRRALQDALIWTGDYLGSVTGGYGPRTRDAIAAYASKHGLAPAALMSAAARKALLANAQTLRQAVAFVTVRDKKTAFVLSLPMRLLGRETPTATGTRYSSPDSTIAVDTLSRPAGDTGLGDVFTRMTSPQPQRKVTYKLLRDDFFVVSGDIADRKFYSRYALGTAGEATLVRGFTFSYPQANAARLDPIALAVAASFDPFPGPGSPTATPSTPVVAAQPPPVAAPPPVGVDAQAIMVAPGVALTSVTRQSCPNPQLDKVDATFRAEDPQNGLALLAVTGRAGAAQALAATPVNDHASIVVLFNGRTGTTFAAPGQALAPTADNFSVSAPLQAASRGAPIFDRQGGLVGLTGASKLPPTIAGTVLQADYVATGVRPIAKLLDEAGIAHAAPSGGPLRFGDVVAARRSQVATVTCGRG